VKRVSTKKIGEELLRSNEGSVLTEFAISFLLLILFCFGLITFGTLLNDYLKVVQIADEAIRTLSAVPGLQETEVAWSEIDAPLSTACSQNSASDPRCGHVLAQSRVFFLIQAMNLDSTGITIESARSVDNVSIMISLPFSGVATIVPGVPISVVAEGPYLF
jgi:hypothetical protein